MQFLVFRLLGVNIVLMKHFLVLLISLITLNSDLFASHPTFINIITNSDTIHNPTLTGVSETGITLDTGIVILIDDVNAVMVYGSTKRLPFLAGAACGYLGFFPGLFVTILIAPGFMEGGTDEIVGTITFFGTAVLSAIYAYKTTHRILREKNKKMVYMDRWSIEEKRDFFINTIP